MTTVSQTPEIQNFPTASETMARYPRLTAHLVCESLGYFTPTTAALAIRDHRIGRAHHCEWYSHMAGSGRTILEIGAQTIGRAFRRRQTHRGYLAHYPHARALVEHQLRNPGHHHEFSSWQ